MMIYDLDVGSIQFWDLKNVGLSANKHVEGRLYGILDSVCSVI